MISGKIEATWSQIDFKNVPWRNNKDPFQGFHSNSKVERLYGNLVNIGICNDVPEGLITVAKSFGLRNSVCALNKMTETQVLPFHRDKYSVYCRKNDVKDVEKICRIILFLEDSLPGQQLWIEDQFCSGPAGSYFGWMGSTMHMAANLNESTRYTLQITGIKD
jgi:hypothetical protein